jgi:hypothetical protein
MPLPLIIAAVAAGGAVFWYTRPRASAGAVDSVAGFPTNWTVETAGARIYDAYKGYPYMSLDLADEIAATAERIGANPFLLANVLRAESQFSPRAQAAPGPVLERAPNGKGAVFAFNPQGGATGLLQWIPKRLAELGTTVEDVFYSEPVDHMPLVESYFSRFAPFPTKQSFYLAVFYPPARKADPNTPFADPRVAAQHGTPADYMAFVDKYARLREDGSVQTSAPASGYFRPPSEKTAALEKTNPVYVGRL